MALMININPGAQFSAIHFASSKGWIEWRQGSDISLHRGIEHHAYLCHMAWFTIPIRGCVRRV